MVDWLIAAGEVCSYLQPTIYSLLRPTFLSISSSFIPRWLLYPCFFKLYFHFIILVSQKLIWTILNSVHWAINFRLNTNVEIWVFVASLNLRMLFQLSHLTENEIHLHNYGLQDEVTTNLKFSRLNYWNNDWYV